MGPIVARLKEAITSQRTLQLRFFDDTRRPGVVAVDDLVSVLRHFQAAVRNTLEAQAGIQRRTGPRRRWVVEASRLAVTGTQVGSFVVELAPAAEAETADWIDRAIDAVLDGIVAPSSLPENARVELEAIARYLRRSDTLRVIEFRSSNADQVVILAPEFAPDWTNRARGVDQRTRLAGPSRERRPPRPPREVIGPPASSVGGFFSPLTPNQIAERSPVFRWDEHERIEFDVEAFLTAIHGRE